jgi:gluconate 2-dehydrogenase gamma chain
MSNPSDDPKIDRRNFLKVVGGGAAAGALPVASPAAAQTPHGDMHPPGHTPPGQSAASPGSAATKAVANTPPAAYQFFNADEAAFIEAAVDTLIPSDETGPGALEAGVATFIDRQMAGAYGRGYRMYLAGPFGDGTPQQGWQLAMTPAELIRAGIADVDAYSLRQHKKNFAFLSPADRAAVLTQVDAGKADLKTVPPAFFFNQLLILLNEGYFGDPLYGGNRDKAVWKMIGFPGADAMYVDKIEEYRNKPYNVEPQSIQDLS